jgi:hypothetical protein
MPMYSRLTFGMTASQLDQLRQYAEEKRMTLSRAVRRLLLETDRRTLAAVGRPSINL